MTDLAKRIVEAAARAYCHADGECPCATPGDCEFWGGVAGDMRAAIAAAVKEAGLDAEDMLDNAAFLVGGAQARRQHEFSTGGTPGGIAFTDSMERLAALLRALAGIADAR